MPHRSSAAGADAPPTRVSRGSISAEMIVEGAFELAGRDGVDGLSMPKLARHLSIGVTSIYWYFKSKDELLDALTAEALIRFYAQLPTFEELPWDERLREHFRAFRRVFREDDVLCDLILLRSGHFEGNSLAVWWPRFESILVQLQDAGFSSRAAADAYFVLSVYVRGAVVVERVMTPADHPRPSTTYQRTSRLDRDAYPLTYQAALEHSFTGVADEEFERGLDLTIKGLRDSVADQD
ncbi:TetR family transcriptional regulator [Pseudonocardia kunmingensis]|uniref:TetR family transcriptional regulator n=1 Tax=Pseudonocardia kunmingensis TaxID=630975 RepID=A0A543DPH7_9PSEU|nr:TetR family transcriptional regulator [Pseudonocardia kunmingensis]TQM11240.1 TetR family transcriptional regulator [Pseudonocardia kunmingensis]